MTRSSTIPNGRGRARRVRATGVAGLATLIAALVATPAMALPPGGPNEQRGGAAITLTARVVQPVGTPNGGANVGKVRFTGTGFTDHELVQVKIDDGAVRPDPAARPPAPDGAQPNSDDWFVALEATGAAGTLTGEVDLADVLADDADELLSGKHHLRFVSTYTDGGTNRGRSIHADFVLGAVLPKGEVPVAGRAVTLGPGADVPVAQTPARTFDDIPKLLPGSLVPFDATGYTPGQKISIKDRDAGAVLATLTADANGHAATMLPLPADVAAGGTSWLRVQGDSATGNQSSHVAPYAVAPAATPSTLDVAATAQRGRGLALAGTGLLKAPFYLTGNPADGQTVTARLDGTGTPFDVRADATGTLAGELPIPADTPLGPHTVDLYVGFRAGSDAPQAVYRRTVEVTEFVANPTPETPTTPGTPTTPTTPQTPIAAPPGGQASTPPQRPGAPAPERAAHVASSSLRAAKQRVAVRLGRGSVGRTVAVTVRTRAKVRVGRRSRVVTLAQVTGAALKAGTAGQSTTLRLRLTAEGRALLRRVPKVRVVVRVAPRGAKAFSRTVWLRG